MLTNVDASPPPPVRAGDGGRALFIRKERARLEARGRTGAPAKSLEKPRWTLAFAVARLGFSWLSGPEKDKKSQ
jgi:hypothetical protein